MHFQQSTRTDPDGSALAADNARDSRLAPCSTRSTGVARGRSRWERLPAVVTLLIAVAGVFSYSATYRHFLKPSLYPVIRSDGAGYYSYLPAYLLQRDPTFRTFVAQDLRGQTLYQTGFKLQPNGKYLQRYPVGEAVMLTPFFLAGHAIARVAAARPDGYSGPEQGAAGVAGLVYMVLGLEILRRSLRRYFSPLVVAATLVGLVFGTNLFHFSTFDSMFSHAFSFFLVAALIWLVDEWYRKPTSPRLVVGLGAVIGLTVLVRQSNVIFLLVLPLFGLWSFSQLQPRISFLWAQRARLLSMAVVAAAVFSPQLLIWHEATGHWLVNSYKGDNVGFNFGSPHLVSTLFSFSPHGLFPWSPVLLLACAGVIAMWRHARELFVPVVVVFVLDVYLIASWTVWYYGGGYGHRGFVDVLPFLAFPLASLFAAVRSVMARVTVSVAVTVCCVLVTIQMIHYWQLKSSFTGATFHQYLHLLATPL